MKRDIIYVGDIAELMGTSEASIRSHLQRSAWPGAIPPPFKIGRRWAWRICNVHNWLDAKAMVLTKKSRKCGRPTKSATVVKG